MNQILCSTGAIIGKPNNNDYRLLREYAPKLECDGFELMMSSSWYSHIDQVIDDIKSYRLSIPVVHSQKSLGESMSGMTVRYSGGRYNEYVMTEEEDRKNFEDGTSRFAANLRLAEGVGAKKWCSICGMGWCPIKIFRRMWKDSEYGRTWRIRKE